jgi:hypothetical protein
VFDMAGVPAFVRLPGSGILRWVGVQLQGLCVLTVPIVPALGIYLQTAGVCCLLCLSPPPHNHMLGPKVRAALGACMLVPRASAVFRKAVGTFPRSVTFGGNPTYSLDV